MRNNSFTGIDRFRIAAAIMIIAIHTYPLLTYSEMADFILVHIICRIGVPFFFMTSGFFLLKKGIYDSSKLLGYLKKMVLLYVVSILLYLPVNIYAGYFNKEHLLPNIVKDLFFDGTFYHLWYIPAAIIGACIAWIAIKYLGWRGAVIIASVLYIIGLFGDSYYGISEQIPVLKGAYGNLFELSDYTRNGVFFAPIFFILGGIANHNSMDIIKRKAGAGLCISLLLMSAEGLLLHYFKMQKHDSMYIMLIPCMIYLFNLLKTVRGRRVKIISQMALAIYVVHPIMILIVRMAGRLTHTENIFVYNSIGHFAAVTILSIAAAYFIVRVIRFFRPEKAAPLPRVCAEINAEALRHNVSILREKMNASCKMMAVVKANAYGHGAELIATLLNEEGIEHFAVATIDEGISLRKEGIKGDILILGYTDPLRARELNRYALTQTVINVSHAYELNKQKKRIAVHIKIDTGMHRLGIDPGKIHGIENIFRMRYLKVTGIYTHLCVSDSLSACDVEYTLEQIRKMEDCIAKLSRKGIRIPEIHLQNSSGLLNYPYLQYSYARIGIALYGVKSSILTELMDTVNLRPVMTLKSHIIMIRSIQKGESVGYERNFTAERDSMIAVIPAGYADGIPRSLSKNGSVLVRGIKVPIVGMVCMDQLMVDITDIADASVGDAVVFIGKEGALEIPAEEFAEQCGSITNEILSRLGDRVERICI